MVPHVHESVDISGIERFLGVPGTTLFCTRDSNSNFQVKATAHYTIRLVLRSYAELGVKTSRTAGHRTLRDRSQGFKGGMTGA